MFDKPNNIKAFFFDNDSTVFNHSNIGGHILPSTIDAMKKLSQNGYKTCMITSRGYEEMYNVPKSFLDLFDDVALLSGAYIKSKGNKVEYIAIDQKTVKKAIKLFDEIDVTYRYATIDGGGFLNRHDEDKEGLFKRLYDMVPDVKKYEGEEVPHFIVYADDKTKEIIKNELKDVEYANLGISYEITASGIDKGSTLERMCKKYNLSLENSCAFGDSGNDISMLKKAKLGICMGNGVEVAKNVADYITDNIWEDGLANALKHFSFIE